MPQDQETMTDEHADVAATPRPSAGGDVGASLPDRTLPSSARLTQESTKHAMTNGPPGVPPRGRHRATSQPTGSGPRHRIAQIRAEGIGGWIAHRRWWVLLAAAILVALTVPIAEVAEQRMTAVPFAAQDEAFFADRMLSESFAGGPPHVIVMATSASGADDPQAAQDAQLLTDQLLAQDGVRSVDSYWSVGLPELRSMDGQTGLLLVRLDGDEQTRISTASRLLPLVSDTTVGTLAVKATGEATVAAALDEQMEADLVRAELITAPLALIVLVLVFGSIVAAGLPLLVSVITVLTALAVLTVLTFLVEVSSFSLNLVTAIGIGLAVDYSLFVTTRFREQLAAGDQVPQAVSTAVRTAGRTVWFSALTVALGFAAPLVFPSMRSLAYAGIAVAILAAAISTTVLPAVLAAVGHRIDSADPLRRWHARRSPTTGDQGFWHRLATTVMRKPVLVVLGVTAILILLAVPFGRANFGVQDDRILPIGHPVHEAGQLLRAGFEGADVASTFVVLPGFDATADPAALNDYATGMSSLENVQRVDTATGSFAAGTQVADPAAVSARFVGDGGTWLQVLGTVEPFTAAGTQLVEDLRALPAPTEALVGGAAAGLLDTRNELLDRLVWALLIVMSATFILLFLFTGGLLIPLKAIVLNLLSLTATFGAMVFVFQDGNLQWLVGDFTATGYLDIGIPVLIFFVAFGLSMDYELFLLSRITEEYRRCGDNTLAVARGLQRTGRIVTAAAALLAVVLAAMATSGVSSLKLLGVGLALAVLLDATLIRALLVPAIMRLAGDANWWAPAWLRRLHHRWGLTDV